MRALTHPNARLPFTLIAGGVRLQAGVRNAVLPPSGDPNRVAVQAGTKRRADQMTDTTDFHLPASFARVLSLLRWDDDLALAAAMHEPVMDGASSYQALWKRTLGLGVTGILKTGDITSSHARAIRSTFLGSRLLDHVLRGAENPAELLKELDMPPQVGGLSRKGRQWLASSHVRKTGLWAGDWSVAAVVRDGCCIARVGAYGFVLGR